jgi:hypothetical protein
VDANRVSGERRQASFPAAAIPWRAPTADFLPSFVGLQDAVRKACASHSEWEARVAAGINATLDFAAAEPDAIHALTIDARRQTSSGGNRQDEVIAYFAELLGGVAPAESRHSASSDESIIESIAVIVRGHLLSGTTDQLTKLAPDVIYLILMPYVGIAAAGRWADAFALAEI